MLLWAGSENAPIMKRWPWVISRVSSFMPPCRRLFVEEHAGFQERSTANNPGELQTAVHSSLSTPVVSTRICFPSRHRPRQLPHDPIRTRSELRDETLSSRITRSPQAPRRSVAAEGYDSTVRAPRSRWSLQHPRTEVI